MQYLHLLFHLFSLKQRYLYYLVLIQRQQLLANEKLERAKKKYFQFKNTLWEWPWEKNKISALQLPSSLH